MKQYIVSAILGLLCTGLQAYSQSPLSGSGFVYAGLDVYSGTENDAFSFCRNPAVLAENQPFRAGMASERRFMLAEATGHILVTSFPTPVGAMGTELRYAGSALYHEQSFSLAYAKKLGNPLSAGIRLGYRSRGIPGFAKEGSPFGECGLIAEPANSWKIGIKVGGYPASASDKPPGNVLGLLWGWGIGFDASRQCHLMADILKDNGDPVSITAGIQYHIKERLLIRAGVETSAGIAFWGFGFRISKFRVDVCVSYHPSLGTSPGTSIQYYGKYNGNA